MSAGYTYNGNGQRIKINVNGTTTVFHYNLSGQIIAESNSSGTITAEYVYLNGQPLAKIEGANVYYYHNDHLATPQKMTDSTGTVVWAADFKPFGETTITVNTITNNLRFPGQYFDAETGLNYNYFRDYNPVIGRYVEADPIGLRGGINLYSYVWNRPTMFIDPSGLAGISGQAGLQGAAHMWIVGLSVSCGGMVGGGTNGAGACGFCTVCLRLGPGFFVGGGITAGGGGYTGALSGTGGLSVGAGGDAGWGPSVGIQMTGGSSSVSGTTGTRYGGGGGISLGFDICWTELRCRERPSCSR